MPKTPFACAVRTAIVAVAPKPNLTRSRPSGGANEEVASYFCQIEKVHIGPRAWLLNFSTNTRPSNKLHNITLYGDDPTS